MVLFGSRSGRGGMAGGTTLNQETNENPQRFPHSANEFADMAERMIERLRREPSADNLFSAILAVNHLPEWYQTRFSGKAVDASQWPEWHVIRQLANGTKHARRRGSEAHPHDLNLKELEWGDADGWHHFGSAPNFWMVQVDGKPRSVYVLCYNFLKRYRSTHGL